MIKLDAYDKKILEVLLNNAREQISTIAKKVRLRRENVNYKINRLVKDGLIKEAITIFNEEKLGLSRYVLFLELINLQEESEKEILNYLKQTEYVSWIGINAGKWSLIFDIIIREKDDLDKIVNNFLNKFGRFIGDYTILNSKQIGYYSEKMFGLKASKEVSKKIENIKFDEIDIKILSILNENAWINYVKIAERVGLTPNAVNNRVRNLERRGIIIGYTISLDWKKLGWELYGLQLKIIKFENEINNKLISYFKENNRVIFYYKYLGGTWDYDIGIIVKDTEELREYINEFRAYFSDFIKISDASAILKEVTGYKLPKMVFE